MIIDRFRADGKVALVTGGGRGIGLGISRALGEAGASVIASSRTDTGAAAALQKEGLDVTFRPADLTEPGAGQALIDGVVAERGRIDILVNNSGVADVHPTETFDDARLERLMSLNFDAVFRCCRAALGPMKAQGGGVILNIGSISAIISNIPQPQAAYNASKAAVHMLTKSLASDHAADNIRVNCIAPGYIETDMTRYGLQDPEMAPVWQEMTPMRRTGTAEDIAAAALYLVTDASSYCTGTVLVIDGGYTTR